MLEHLPIDDVIPPLCAALAEGRNVVLTAPTGAGKTTRVAPAIFDGGLTGGARVVVLEPRRLAARAAARRIAEERGAGLGSEVGYRVRFDHRASEATRLLIVTEGVFVRMLQADPFLDDVAAVVLDEFHERNLDSDLALALLRQVQREARDDLRLIVMSATLDADQVSRLTGFLEPCAAIAAEGRSHPVAVDYLEQPDDRPIPVVAAAGVRRVLHAGDGGDLLVFLPGVGEIRRTQELLEPLSRERHFATLPLYGALPPSAQDAALRRPVRGARRRVILATNVAESSVTVEGVHSVVDTGWARILRHDPGCGLNRLELRRISRASAEQRRGRAGRLGPGHCLRLWTRGQHRGLVRSIRPEIQRVDLTGLLLELRCWGEVDPLDVNWLDPPPETALEQADELLRDLGAVDASGIATERGRAMVGLPVHPRLARVVIEGRSLGCLPRAALVAAMLGERRPFRGDGPDIVDKASALDLARLIEGYEQGGEACRDALRRGLVTGRARFLLKVRRQLVDLARRGPMVPATSLAPQAADPAAVGDEVRRTLLAGFPDRVARRRGGSTRRAIMVGGRGLAFDDELALAGWPLFVALDVDAGRRGRRAEARVRLACGVRERWLHTTVEVSVAFDEAAERVVAVERECYRDLVLRERPVQADPEAAARILAEAAAAQPERALGLDPPREDVVARFLARLRCLAEWMPELDLPSVTGPDLIDLLPALCAGRRSFDELRQAPLLDVLRGRLSHEQRRALAREAPERLEIPSGRRVRLEYEVGRPPVLAARIQELFGLTETPRVGGGRVPVMVHLLAPNLRPQQVTQDLKSFWDRTYHEVRKELRRRYPKHAWPEDPWSAEPERRPGRRRR